MRITGIQVDNLIGIKSIDVRPSAAVTLFAGINGAGKSSIRDAVVMAIAQESARGVALKKNYGMLVNDKEKQGGALVTLDDSHDYTFAFNMPKGDFKGPEISDSMRVSLDGQRFASMTPDERRTFLFDLTKCKRNGAAIKARMLAEPWECEETKVEAVLPLLRTGFPDACEAAKKKATESKGAWRQLTGETYGPEKAPNWVAAKPEVPAGDAAQLGEDIAALDKTIASLIEQIGTIKNIARTAQETTTRRAALADSAGKVASLTEQLERAKAELADYLPKIEGLRLRAAGTARVGLVHDMAAYLSDITDITEVSEGQRLLARYEAEHGKMGGKVDTEAQAELPAHEQGLQVIQNRVKNLQRDLDSATQAKGQFDALAPADDAVDASKEIAELEGMLTTTRADRAKLQNQLLDIEVAKKAAAESDSKTKEALGHHNDVAAWLKVAAALAPNGIPDELLKAALGPVNATLAQAAVDTDWFKVAIESDMSITAAGRMYQMLSVSEKWRVDAHIAQAVAEISELRILVLDGVDVLDLPGRSQLFGWLDTLVEYKLLDSALLFATLKEAPKNLPDTVQSFWVENGTIPALAREQQAA